MPLETLLTLFIVFHKTVTCLQIYVVSNSVLSHNDRSNQLLIFSSIRLVAQPSAAKNMCNNHYIEGDIDSFMAVVTPRIGHVSSMVDLFKKEVCPFSVLP